MRLRNLGALVALLLLTVTTADARHVGQRPTYPVGSPDRYTGRYVVQLSEGCHPAVAQQAARACGGDLIRFDGEMALVTGNLAQLRRAFAGTARYVEPEVEMRAMSAGWGDAPMTALAVPNDPYFRYQWGLSRIAAPKAHDRATGKGVTVAIIDTGIRRDTPDLKQTRISAGYDFINNDPDATDDNGHGTHVAGTVAQSTNNGYGCAGTAPGAVLMPVKVLAANGSGSNYSVARGIRWAADHGAQVLNLSLGGGHSRTLYDAVRYAVGKNVIVVAAAGNSGAGSLSFPAAYAEVISVGAIDREDRKASFSQYGRGLSLVAPGVSILQQTITPYGFRFKFFSGTSMATPHVAGVCALVREQDNASSPAAIKERLQRTARDLGTPGTDPTYGAGCVDAGAAVRAVAETPPPAPAPDLPPPATGEAGEVVRLLNAERQQAGLAPLAVAVELERAAQKHSADMAARKYFSHTNPDGEGPGERIAREGYRARTWGENIAAGYDTPAAVMNAWMNSPGHRSNILSPHYTEIGVGVVRDPASPYRIYWTQNFGAR